jgi:hypothetical protein
MASEKTTKAKGGVEVGVGAAQTDAQRGNGKRQGANGDGNSNPRTRGLRPPWKKGDVPNPAGRPRGSRHKLSEAFILALQSKFEERGIEAIDRVIDETPGEFLRVVASIVPKQFGLEEGTQNAFLDVWKFISEGRAGAAA